MGIVRKCFGEHICWVGDREYVLHGDSSFLVGLLQVVVPYAYVLGKSDFDMIRRYFICVFVDKEGDGCLFRGGDEV